MKNYNTSKRYFEDKLIHSIKNPEYIYQNKDLTILSSHEDSLYFGYVVAPTQVGPFCRVCGQSISKIKDTRVSYPTIGIINDKPVVLKLIRKLYTCPECNCNTIHQVDGLPHHTQTTAQLKD